MGEGQCVSCSWNFVRLMRQVAFGALALVRVVFFQIDLFQENGTRRVELVAAQANVRRQLHRVVVVRIIAVRLARPVAGFARDGLVLVFCRLRQNLRVALVAGLLAAVARFPRRDFLQRIAAIMAVLPEGFGREDLPRHDVGPNDRDGENDEPDDLRRQFEQAHIFKLLVPVRVADSCADRRVASRTDAWNIGRGMMAGLTRLADVTSFLANVTPCQAERGPTPRSRCAARQGLLRSPANKGPAFGKVCSSFSVPARQTQVHLLYETMGEMERAPLDS